MPSLKHGHDSAQRHDRHLHLVPATLDLTGPIPLIGGVPVYPIYGGSRGEALDFAGLLDVLGYRPAEFVSVCHKLNGSDDFSTQVCAPEDAPAVPAALPEGVDIYFGIHPTKGPARIKRGRGKNIDATRLSSLPADLDFSEGKCGSEDTAMAIITELCEILGTPPSAITHSGGGLHPYWVIARPQSGSALGCLDGYDDIDAAVQPAALLARWKRTVKMVAKTHGAKADSVFELARVLRVPGTFNHKYVSNGQPPIPVTCHREAGGALTAEQVDERLAAYGIRHIGDYPDPDTKRGEPGYAKVISDPGDWEFAAQTCNYMQITIEGWADPGTVEKGTGRHQWLLSQSVRLHCAKMLVCITEADFDHAKDVLAATMIELCNTREPRRMIPPGEIEDAWGFGEDTAATKSKTAARAELGGHKHAKSGERSQASKLVDIALERYELGITPEGKPFGYDPSMPHVVVDLNSRKFGLRPILASDYFEKFNAATTTGAVLSAILTLEGFARKQVPVHLHQRMAGDASAIHIDMADPDNRVIEISGGTWRIVTESPHKFRRTELTAAMPEPKRGDWEDSIPALWKYVNIFKENHPIALAVLVDAMVNPNTAKPVVNLVGHSGTAKTSTGNCFTSLIDPSTAALHSPPKDLQEWLTTASGSYVVGLDNLSKIPSWLSDAICCAATGDAVVKRQLFTDDDLHVMSLLRSVVFTGIDFSGLRGDLSERLISFDLKEIGEDDRKAERELKSDWLADQPVILGGLLDLAAMVHQKLPEMPRQPLPRMADFGKVLLAVDEVTRSDGMSHYRGRLKRVLADSAVNDPFIGHLVDARYDTGADGKTSAQILTAIEHERIEKTLNLPAPEGWPRAAKTVTTLLRHNEVSLRSMGWKIDNDAGSNQSNAVKWFIHPPERKVRRSNDEETRNLLLVLTLNL